MEAVREGEVSERRAWAPLVTAPNERLEELGLKLDAFVAAMERLSNHQLHGPDSVGYSQLLREKEAADIELRRAWNALRG